MLIIPKCQQKFPLKTQMFMCAIHNSLFSVKQISLLPFLHDDYFLTFKHKSHRSKSINSIIILLAHQKSWKSINIWLFSLLIFFMVNTIFTFGIFPCHYEEIFVSHFMHFLRFCFVAIFMYINTDFFVIIDAILYILYFFHCL